MNFLSEETDAKLEQFLKYSNTLYGQDFVEKLLDISEFVVKFFGIEINEIDQEEVEGLKQNIERLLLMNLN